MDIILASASPRRRELLSDLGVKFSVIVSDKEESTQKILPNEIVMDLALRKAMDVYDKVIFSENTELSYNLEDVENLSKYINKDFMIISADTIVVYDDMILGKPVDEKMAYDTLKLLSGNKHQVYTGVCICRVDSLGNKKISNWYEKTDVYMYDIETKDIVAYIKTGEPMDKAGSYGIQGLAKKFIKGISGDYNNVVGLPIARLWYEIKEDI